jgi:hypothetical protein
MAMAVDDATSAWEALREEGLAIQPPYAFQLPGTKLAGGLTILLVRDPDAILVELVERPRSHFRAGGEGDSDHGREVEVGAVAAAVAADGGTRS